MIIKDYIREFEEMGLGMFVHFGLYSVHGKGEWAYGRNISPEEYSALVDRFSPDPDWAEELVCVAKAVKRYGWCGNSPRERLAYAEYAKPRASRISWNTIAFIPPEK